MNEPVRIFLTYDEPEADLAEALKDHLRTAFNDIDIAFFERSTGMPEEREGIAFLQTATCSLALLSNTYLLKGRNTLELAHARREEALRRPAAPLFLVKAEPMVLPAALNGYIHLLEEEDSLRSAHFPVARQLHRVAARMLQLLTASRGDEDQIAPFQAVPEAHDLLDRLGRLTRQADLEPLFDILHLTVEDAAHRQTLSGLRDEWVEVRGWREWPLRMRAQERIAAGLRSLLGTLQSADMSDAWKTTGWRLEDPPRRAPAFHIPGADIQVPAELGGAGRQTYTRNMALCLDALVVGQPERGYALLDQLRQHLAPRSAQMYELLLLALFMREGADAIVAAFLQGSANPFGHIALFCQHLDMCQSQGMCPTSSGSFNRQVIAEALSEAMQRAYHRLHPVQGDAQAWRRQVLTLVTLAGHVYRDIHPYSAALTTLLTAICGGGRGNWIERVELKDNGTTRFHGPDHLDLHPLAEQLIDMLQRNRDWDDQATAMLRADILNAQLAKRKGLNDQLVWEKQRFRRHTVERQEVIHLVHAALFGYHLFGDPTPRTPGNTFLRLALELLIPEQLWTTAALPAPNLPNYPLPLRWFDLDEDGALRTHPNNADYNFDVLAIVRHLVVHASGEAGWSVVQGNLEEAFVRQFVRDTDAQYTYLRENRMHTDFRRMDDLLVRSATIECLNRWAAAYKANPTAYAHLNDTILQELIGNRLLLWFYMNPAQLSTHPDSLGLGYDAKAALRWITRTPIARTQDEIQSSLASNMYAQTIAPSYAAIPPGDGNERHTVAFIMVQALHLYRDLQQDPVYLNLVYEELTREHKLPWIMVDPDGLPQAVPVDQMHGFNAWSVLEQLAMRNPVQWSLMEARRRIATKRHRELLNLYYREINEDRQLNGLPERRILIQIMRQMRAIFHFFPEASFLELSLRELQGKGRMHWQISLLNIFPIPQNQPENHLLDFDYRQERSDVRALIRTSDAWMQHLEDTQTRALLQDTTPDWRNNSI
jgi:hypothetical protein